MGMLRRRTIFHRLFSSFALLVFFTVLLGMGGFYLYGARMVRASTADELARSAQSLNEQMDTMVRSMDQISMQTVSAQTLAGQYYALEDAARVNDAGVVQSRSSQISDTLYATLGAWMPRERQINVVSTGGDFIGTSSVAVYRRLDASLLRRADWISQALTLRGIRYLTPIHRSEWSADHEPVFSLVRMLRRNRLGEGDSDAVLEIQQSYSYLCEQIADTYDGAAAGAVILGPDGSLIYPWGGDPANYEALRALTGRSGTSETVSLGGVRYIAACECSSLTGWTTFALEAEKAYMAPLAELRNLIFLITLALLAAALALSFFAARDISNPIKEIHKRLAALSLNNLEPAKTPSSGSLNELEELNMAFESTCQRLEASLSEAVSARSYEIQARMLALQSQMNPHFIYNTISNIYALADEHGETGIVNMCADLSGMLRYAMSGQQRPVTLGQELSYAESYLRLMKRRFEDNLSYELLADDAARACVVPKLIVQPLVENCFKHGGGPPPWRVRVTAGAGDEGWFVTVEDNGLGFSPEKRAELEAMLASPDDAQPCAGSPEGEGIGLMNIALRLRLTYRGATSMTLGTSELGGALVRISGGKEESRDE